MVFYLMNDVHYYLEDWVPPVHSIMMIAGALFHPVVGTYMLPCREGYY